MTSANAVRMEHRKDLVAASHIDYTTRPQMVSAKENKLYFKLISGIAKETGFGAVLNTSLNKHRRPIALDPEDAIWTLENTGATKLVIGDYLVSKKA
jgi:carbamoyltransferase